MTENLGNTAAVSIIGLREFRRTAWMRCFLAWLTPSEHVLSHKCSTIDFCSLSLQLRLLTCRNSRYKMTAEKGPVLESDIANNTTNHRFGDCVPKVWIFTCSFWAFTIPSPNYVPRLRLFCDLLREAIPLSHSRNFGLGKPIPIALQITGYPAQNRGLFWPSCDLPSCVISPLVCVPQSSIFQRAN